jgi:hypothetical protein
VGAFAAGGGVVGDIAVKRATQWAHTHFFIDDQTETQELDQEATALDNNDPDANTVGSEKNTTSNNWKLSVNGKEVVLLANFIEEADEAPRHSAPEYPDSNTSVVKMPWWREVLSQLPWID